MQRTPLERMEKTMQRWRPMIALALFLGAAAGFVHVAHGQTSEQRSKFTGTFRYAGNAQQEDARRAAIDHAVADMSAFTRSTARSRISATTQIISSYSFSFDPGKIQVRAQSRPDMISGDKGEPADYTYNGKTSQLTQRLVDDRISQTFVSDDGRRENEYTLSPDGQSLLLKVTVISSRLSTPVIYSLSYKKAD